MKSTFKVILLLLIGLAFSFVGAHGQTKPFATVKGKVTDSMDAVVPNIPIVFANDGRSYRTKTNDDGEYNLTLESGKYKVSTEAALGLAGTRRSEVLLEPDSAKTLNLRVYPAHSLLVDMSDGSKHSTQCISGTYYEEIPALSTVGVSSGMVRYGLNNKKGSILTFDPFSKHEDQVSFTYDFFSVTADKISINTRTKEILALGNVQIELENKNEKYSGTVKIHIDKGKVVYKKL